MTPCPIRQNRSIHNAYNMFKAFEEMLEEKLLNMSDKIIRKFWDTGMRIFLHDSLKFFSYVGAGLSRLNQC